jgi:plasmid stabilization system protein ParE
MKIRFSPRAVRDLNEIADYIRTRNPAAALTRLATGRKSTSCRSSSPQPRIAVREDIICRTSSSAVPFARRRSRLRLSSVSTAGEILAAPCCRRGLLRSAAATSLLRLPCDLPGVSVRDRRVQERWKRDYRRSRCRGGTCGCRCEEGGRVSIGPAMLGRQAPDSGRRLVPRQDRKAGEVSGRVD